MSTNDTSLLKAYTRYMPPTARILLGLPLLVFGLNVFHPFFEPPKTPMSEAAMAFAGALQKTGYMMELIGVTQIVSGLLLLLNRFVPLALALFAPFILNSVLFHIFLERGGLPMSLIFLALELYLAWAYRKSYAPMLEARVVLK